MVSWRVSVAVLVVLALAAVPADAVQCGPEAGNKQCAGAKECCSIRGFCGTGIQYCSMGNCHSGACTGKVAPLPKPTPKQQVNAASATSRRIIEVRQGGTARLECKGGNVISSLWGVRYGNPAKKCGTKFSPRVVNAVTAACLHKSKCAIPVTNAKLGVPCHKVRKSLRLGYQCGKPTVQPKSIPNPKPAIKPNPNIMRSSLWGIEGRPWTPRSKLTDQSYAGYMANEAKIPNYPVRFNVKAFGAVGNQRKDDTAAFKKAIEAASRLAATMSEAPEPGGGFQNKGGRGVAILVPAGKYRITEALEILQSNVVLRGAGTKKTILYFPKSLSAIYGNKEEWANSGSFISIAGFNPGFKHERSAIAPLTAPARRGDRLLQVRSTTDIQLGMWVRIVARERYRGPTGRRLTSAEDEQAPQERQQWQRHMLQANRTAAAGDRGRFMPLTPALREALEWGKYDLMADKAEEDGVITAAAPGSLDDYLYGDMPHVDSGRNSFDKADHIGFISRVIAKGPKWIQLERPLNYDLRLHWQPWVNRYAPQVQHSGFERFTVWFRPDKYPEHHSAHGYNGVAILDSGNCWIRKVKVVNADNAFGVFRSDFVTVTGVTVAVSQPRHTPLTFPSNGHHALWGSRAINTVFTNFNINTEYIHDITFAVFSENLVFANGKGVNINLDFHRGGPHNNLASNINLGRGTRPFHSGGAKNRGAYAAANNTIWNVRPAANRQVPLPSCDFGPHLVFIGSFSAPAQPKRSGKRLLLNDGRRTHWCEAHQWWVENKPLNKRLEPLDMYRAMVARRVKRVAG